jgi:hypothetical protein
MAAELDPAFEQQLAELSDDDWRSLSARVRPPTSREQLRDVASKHIPEGQLDAFLAVVNPKAFANELGDVDEAKVAQHASIIFGVAAPEQSPPAPPRQWGQHSAGGGPGKRAGDDGRAALQTRHGVKNDAPQFDQGIRPGDSARAALEARYGRTSK